MPGSVQSQVGWDFEQRGVADDPAHGRGLEQDYLWGPFNPNHSLILYTLLFQVTKQRDSSSLQTEAETRGRTSTQGLSHTLFIYSTFIHDFFRCEG